MQCLAFPEDIDRAVRKITYSFYRRFDLSRHFNNTYEDLLAEARIAAVIAIRKFDATKKVKLKTYVTSCVKNRLMDINKVQYYKKSASYSYEEQKLNNLIIDPWQDAEWHLETSSFKKEKDRHVLLMVLAGYRKKEMHSEFVSSYGLSIPNAKKKVNECLLHIATKLYETNQG